MRPWDVEEMTWRQIYLLLVDMHWHYDDINSIDDPEEYEKMMSADPRKIWADYKPFKEE